ncbi:MAG: serine/threonine protein kinase [Planctomycetaceae bacterium]
MKIISQSRASIDWCASMCNLIEELTEQVKRGERIDLDAVVAAHPEYADDLRKVLPTLELLAEVGPSAARAAFDAGARPAVADAIWGTLGDFRIVREIGRGGMGVVYEAQQISLDRRVALKVLPFTGVLDERHLQRFKNEARAAAGLHHPNIVPVYAVGTDRGMHFYAMQYIEGRTLADTIRDARGEESVRERQPSREEQPKGEVPSAAAPEDARAATSASRAALVNTRSTAVIAALSTRPLSQPREHYRKIARLVWQAAEALDHAHQLGVVHRDVKPANMLVDAASKLWVTDFGLAQLHADTGLTRSGDLLGTFRYMSPEQTSGQRAVLDHRTDIYSLGATFYELLTLEPVFDGETRQELMYQILHQEPRPPRQLNRAIPPELETIVLKALSKAPAERYASAAELAADVQRYLDDQPIKARRPSLVDRARKWSRRHPSVIVAGVLLLSVIAVSLLISNRLISREQQKTAAALAGEKLRADQAAGQLRQARQTVEGLIQVAEMGITDDDMSVALPRLRDVLSATFDQYQSFADHLGSDVVSQPDFATIQMRVERTLSDLAAKLGESSILGQQLLMVLLWSPGVLEDLGLSGDQHDRVSILRQSWRDDWRAAAGTARNQNEKNDGDTRLRFVRLAQDYDRLTRDAISTQQYQRLQQIAVQVGIFRIFNGSALPQALNLAPELRGVELFHIPDLQGPGGRRQRGNTRDSTLDDAALEVTDWVMPEWINRTGKQFLGFLDNPAVKEPDGGEPFSEGPPD